MASGTTIAAASATSATTQVQTPKQTCGNWVTSNHNKAVDWINEKVLRNDPNAATASNFSSAFRVHKDSSMISTAAKILFGWVTFFIVPTIIFGTMQLGKYLWSLLCGTTKAANNQTPAPGTQSGSGTASSKQPPALQVGNEGKKGAPTDDIQVTGKINYQAFMREMYHTKIADGVKPPAVAAFEVRYAILEKTAAQAPWIPVTVEEMIKRGYQVLKPLENRQDVSSTERSGSAEALQGVRARLVLVEGQLRNLVGGNRHPVQEAAPVRSQDPSELSVPARVELHQDLIAAATGTDGDAESAAVPSSKIPVPPSTDPSKTKEERTGKQ
ncbi:MAG: hypothetical protein HY069_00550 [Chlamydiia bacterium]|nr:hypothetical protein [Chlamydiia bacterium]